VRAAVQVGVGAAVGVGLIGCVNLAKTEGFEPPMRYSLMPLATR